MAVLAAAFGVPGQTRWEYGAKLCLLSNAPALPWWGRVELPGV
jgi:hypothetical protein